MLRVNSHFSPFINYCIPTTQRLVRIITLHSAPLVLFLGNLSSIINYCIPKMSCLHVWRGADNQGLDNLIVHVPPGHHATGLAV